MGPLLKLSGLSKTLGSSRQPIRALADIDLEVQPGDTLGIVGESSCGKTTLVRCATRLIEPDTGTVEFDGVDLLRLPREELRRKRREFQMVFQDPASSLNPRMTVEQILSEPFEAHHIGTKKERRIRVRELLDMVALDRALIEEVPGHLSGGQQQRVGIARALALKPKLLIADEPVSALDASVQAQILNLLADLQKSMGVTMILISHSLAVVHYMCKRVVVMYCGRIIEEAPAELFFREPRHPYSRMLLASTPALSLSVFAPDASRGDLPSPTHPPPGCAFHPRCAHAFSPCRASIPADSTPSPGSRVACFLYT